MRITCRYFYCNLVPEYFETVFFATVPSGCKQIATDKWKHMVKGLVLKTDDCCKEFEEVHESKGDWDLSVAVIRQKSSEA